MRVLVTNCTLAGRTGTETFVRDLALGLQAAGAQPIVYAPELGPLAEELRAASIPVVDDLRSIAEPPDVIHGHHHEETARALMRFPGAPALFVSHDWSAWTDVPLEFPQLRRFVAVDRTRRDRLVVTQGIDPERVSILPNSVDVDRFQPRGPLPARPRNGLVFSSYLRREREILDLRRACAQTGLSLDVAGARLGRYLEHPEVDLKGYDLVFAMGRSALEAMAVGNGVVVWGLEGLGGFVNQERFPHFLDCNFGRRLLRRASQEDLEAAIQDFDSGEATWVQGKVRTELRLDGMVRHYLGLYEELLAESQAHPVPLEATLRAGADYLDHCVSYPQVESLLRRKISRSAKRIRVLADVLAFVGILGLALLWLRPGRPGTPSWFKVTTWAIRLSSMTFLLYFRSLIRARAGQLARFGWMNLLGLKL